MPIRAREFDRMVNKFGFQTRHGRDLHAWLAYEGNIVVRTRRSKSSGDLPMEHSIRQQMKLNRQEFNLARRCTMTRDQYIEILKRKGVI